jgi:hypothetical protein
LFPSGIRTKAERCIDVPALFCNSGVNIGLMPF